MAQTKVGAIKNRDVLIAKYGNDYFAKLGRKGGKATGLKGFALNRDLASRAGKIGGKIGGKHSHSTKPVVS